VRELVQHMYRAINAKRRTLYLLNFYIKKENFKILNPSQDG
jgi:hypothetical protein